MGPEDVSVAIAAAGNSATRSSPVALTPVALALLLGAALL